MVQASQTFPAARAVWPTMLVEPNQSHRSDRIGSDELRRTVESLVPVLTQRLGQ